MNRALRCAALATAILATANLGPGSMPGLAGTSGTINLSWDDCGAFGSNAKTFACNVNTGPTFNMVASYTPPTTLPEFLGLSASLSIQSSSASLPDWWSFGAGFCRGTTALSVSFDFTSSPGSCADFFQGQGGGALAYDVGYEGPDRARLRVQGAMPFDSRGPIDPMNEYYAFAARITRAKSTGSGSCAGCDVPMTIHLDEIQLFQPPEFNYDPVLVNPDHGTTITWSGESPPPGAPEILSFSPTSGTAGTPVTILGRRFTGATSVTFGNLVAAYVVESDSVIGTTAPVSVATSFLTVSTPAGSDQSDLPFVVPDVPAIEGINLSWDDCGLNGAMDMAVACDSNTGPPFTMVVSFSPPPGVDSLWGATAEIDVISDSGTLPDWWKVGPSGCRGVTGVMVNSDFTSGPYSCTDHWGGSAFVSYSMNLDPYAPNRGRLLVGAATPIGSEAPVDPDREYYLIKINVMRSKSTGPERCSGCEVPACIVLNSVELRQAQGSTFDPVLTMPRDRNFVRWGTPSKCPVPTSALASLVHATAENGRVRLEWMTEEIQTIALHRRQAEGEWRIIASLRPDGAGRVRYDDTDVAAGTTYGYRLGVEAGGREVFVGDTEVMVPASGSTLALTRALWDRKAVTVSLSLARSAPARLELFDVGGRLRAARSLAALGPGDHEVRLAADNPLEAGVYFMRLSQDGQQVTRRFAMSR